eukprot:1178507-Prorocentrum_minimum.AAC.5
MTVVGTQLGFCDFGYCLMAAVHFNIRILYKGGNLAKVECSSQFLPAAKHGCGFVFTHLGDRRIECTRSFPWPSCTPKSISLCNVASNRPRPRPVYNEGTYRDTAAAITNRRNTVGRIVDRYTPTRTESYALWTCRSSQSPKCATEHPPE